MEKASEKLNNSLSNNTEKKQWVTPTVDIISNDTIQSAPFARGAENSSFSANFVS